MTHIQIRRGLKVLELLPNSQYFMEKLRAKLNVKSVDFRSNLNKRERSVALGDKIVGIKELRWVGGENE